MSNAEHRQVLRRNGLLGTIVDVSIVGAPSDVASIAVDEVLDEIQRLQRVFNMFDPTSELSRWRRGEETAGPELGAVIADALGWRNRTNGAFDPAVGILQELWDGAELRNEVPSDTEIEEARAEMRHTPIGWSLNGIAKGWIVDRAADLAFQEGLMLGLVVNAGGDLLSLGSKRTIVGIENPGRPYDNVPPLARVAVADGALATSGNSRRGWRIAGERFGHVLDPRTGRPATGTESASVIARTAADADVLATSLTILEPAAGLELADELDVGCLVIDSAGHTHRNGLWREAEEQAQAY